MSQQQKMKVNLNEIKLKPDLTTVCRKKISDKEYFSEEYKDYISNSRLGLINPEQNGSPNQYWEGLKEEKTTSLNLGSYIHQLILQPEEFYLVEDLNKPSGKLGLVVEQVKSFRNQGFKLIDAINHACNIVHYYEKSITPKRIKKIISEGIDFYLNSNQYLHDERALIPTSKDRNVITSCVNNIQNNRQIQNLLKPIDVWGDEILAFNEDAFFINFTGIHNDETCDLKFKMKADNWTIDLVNKVITLNDLKTTSHNVDQFMFSSFQHYFYSRQFAGYLYVILRYCEKEYGYNTNEWTYKCNVVVSETRGDHKCAIFPITQEVLDQGRKDFCRLLKMVAYCEMYGYSNDYEFI